MKHVLILTDKLKYACGVTSYVYNLITYSPQDKVKYFLFAAPGDRVEDFRKLGIKLFISKHVEYDKKNIFTIIYTFSKLVYIVRKHKIDIIHSQNYYLANISKVLKKIFRVKTLQTKNNLYPQGRLSQFCSDHYIVVNKDIKEVAVKLFKVNRNDISVIEYGIPLNNYSIKKDAEKLKILTLSRLVSVKGIDVFIKAVAKLDKVHKENCEFIIAGEGEEKQNLVLLNNELEAGVKFFGKTKNPYELFAGSHIFVIPSIWDMEGFPLSIVEAGFAKNLIIASNFRGLSSYFEDGIDGFVFEKGNVDELKEILKETIRNYKMYYSLIEKAHNKFREIFNIHNMIKKTMNIYETL